MLKKKYFLTYVDILGFKERTEKEPENSGIKPEEVRIVYRDRIKRKLDRLKASEAVMDYQETSLDSWLLFSDDIWKAFRSVGEVIKTDLCFEVAIGMKEFDELPLREELTFLRNETMEFLKNNILSPYKSWYKEKYEESVKQTFVLLTPEAYKELDYKKAKSMVCKPYELTNFYLLNQEEFDRKLLVLEFLEKIGLQRIEYREIEKLYVKPENYKEIDRILEQNNIVFIIGDPEMGKTYTAINLLLKFFKEKFEPVYIPEERKGDQWSFVRQTTELEGKAIYLEDPWGKVEFKRAESLFRDVGNFIERVRRKRCKVIITSREKVFKEFEKKKETSENLWQYVSELKVNLAYGETELREMLIQYMELFEPFWCNNDELRSIAFEAVKGRIRTPMSIKQLIEYTIDAADKDNLRVGIEKAAEETKISFAKEIKEMFNGGKYDHIVFLSFAYIEIDLEIAKSCYEEVLTDLKYDLMKATDFNDFFEEFSEVQRSGLMDVEVINYVHPSYKDAFTSALWDNNRPHNISKKIFSKLLYSLFDKEEATDQCVWAIAKDFDILPEDIRNLLLNLSGSEKTLQYIEDLIENNLDYLPKKSRNELLLKLSEIDKTAEYVAWTIEENFNLISEDVRNDLLFKLSEIDKTAEGVAYAVEKNFNLISEDVRNDLLLKLSEIDKTAEYVAWTVEENFNLIPEDVRNDLLLKLSERDKTEEGVAWAVAWTVEKNFDKLPEDCRNELLLKLSFEAEAVINVARTVEKNFDKLPMEIRNQLLFKLSKKEKAAKYVARTIKENFDKLPMEIRNQLLFTLSEKEVAAETVAGAIAEHFDTVPEDLKNLLDWLQDHLQCLVEKLSAGDSEDKMSAIKIISNARSKISQNFALSVLDGLLWDENREVRMRAENLYWILFLGWRVE